MQIADIVATASKDIKGRTYLSYEGNVFGWVDYMSGHYTGHVKAYDSLKGHKVLDGAACREDAIWEVLSSFRIWHLGRFATYNLETHTEEMRYVPEDVLVAAAESILDRKYRKQDRKAASRKARKERNAVDTRPFLRNGADTYRHDKCAVCGHTVGYGAVTYAEATGTAVRHEGTCPSY